MTNYNTIRDKNLNWGEKKGGGGTTGAHALFSSQQKNELPNEGLGWKHR